MLFRHTATDPTARPINTSLGWDGFRSRNFRHPNPSLIDATDITTEHLRTAPASTKTGHNTTCNKFPNQHRHFESDAFAVLVPTTRVPVLNNPSARIYSTPEAQAEALQTYKDKAHYFRDRNQRHGVNAVPRVTFLSCAEAESTKDAQHLAGDVNVLEIPLEAFLISPTLHQTEWNNPCWGAQHTQNLQSASNSNWPGAYQLVAPLASKTQVNSAQSATIEVTVRPRNSIPMRHRPHVEYNDQLNRHIGSEAGGESASLLRDSHHVDAKLYPRKFHRRRLTLRVREERFQHQYYRSESFSKFKKESHPATKSASANLKLPLKSSKKVTAQASSAHTPKRSFASRLPWPRNKPTSSLEAQAPIAINLNTNRPPS